MPDYLEVNLEIITHATENEKLLLQSICELFNIEGVEFSQQNLFGQEPFLLLCSLTLPEPGENG